MGGFDAMNTQEKTRCFAVPGALSCIDTVNPATGTGNWSGKTLFETQVRHPGAVEMDLQEFERVAATAQDAPVVWEPITEEKYWYYLEVLPPAVMWVGGFLVGEPSDHHAATGLPRYQGCRDLGNGNHVASSRPMQVKEFASVMTTLNAAD